MGKRWRGKKADKSSNSYKNYKISGAMLLLAVLLTGLLAGCGSGQPDIAIEPPALGLETTYGEMTSCTYATRGGYQWTVHLNDGTSRSVIADSTSPREWQEIATIDMAKTDGAIELQFSPGMKEYTLNYWIEDAACGVADPVPMEGDTILLKDELAKGIYEIYVVYENGNAYYGFRVE